MNEFFNYYDEKTTPIHQLNESQNNNMFFIKRDDLIQFSFGGNKARKAILFFKDIISKGSDCIVTYGSSSSNHCRIISNIAASMGLLCYVISPLENSRPTYNRRMIELFGAKVIKCPIAEVKETIFNTMNRLRKQGFNPYFIQGGGHGNIGTQAYVDVYKEILDFERERGIKFDYVFHASGTGTTQAGLICGNLLNGSKKNIIGISIARRNPYGRQVVVDSVNSYLYSIGKEQVSEEVVCFIDDYVLEGYSYYNNEILGTIREVLIKDGIPLDTTYTGKAFWGMKEYIRKNQIKNKNILFIHTGGTPLFFDELEGLTVGV